jgi:TetR/AcrR family transcriptional regulator
LKLTVFGYNSNKEGIDNTNIAQDLHIMFRRKKTRKLGKQTRDVSEKTKQTVLKSALKIFAQEGFSRARLRDIASLAGTTHSLIRHHFGSKDDLWKAVVNYGLNLQEKQILKIIKSRGSASPVELFKDFIKSYVSTIAKNPELSKILLHDNSRSSPHLNYLIERQKQLHSIVEPVFKNAQKSGYFKGVDHDSFLVYVRALVETPIATRDITNKLLKEDILAKKGIAIHTERVLRFLFHEEK